MTTTFAATDLAFLRDLLETRAGIVLEPGKEYLVETRIAPLLTANKLSGLPELVRKIRIDAQLQKKVIEAFTTNETSFFRDLAPFQSLRATIFPALQAKPDRVRIWSAASSTGQEAYSVAMMLRDEFPSLAARAEIVGTDLNEVVVAKARSGRYTQAEVSRGLPAASLVKHFTRKGLEWEVSEPIRAMTQFRQQNLLEHWPAAPPFDLILLRNVLIYFSLDTRARLLRRMRDAMRKDGWLMLGSSETSAPPESFTPSAGTVGLFRPK
ncbi:MAG: protein-glutamate O-methyltransferase CheR [Myxococcota bacterium]